MAGDWVRASRGATLATGVVSFVAAGVDEADAAIIAYDFDATVTSGPLAGSYSGSFSYDDQTPPQASDATYDYVALETFAFDFAGESLGLADIATFNSPGVRLDDGVFAGLGGVNTGEGGRLFVNLDGGAGNVTFEGEVLGGYISGSGLTGTVSYVPEPAHGLLITAALLTLACQRNLAELWAKLRRRPTS